MPGKSQIGAEWTTDQATNDGKSPEVGGLRMALVPFFCLYAHLWNRDTQRGRDNTEKSRDVEQKQRHRWRGNREETWGQRKTEAK